VSLPSSVHLLLTLAGQASSSDNADDVSEEWGVRGMGPDLSLSTFFHELIEFKFELAPAVFFF